MANWANETDKIVEFAIVAVFGFGIALYLGSTLFTALPPNSSAANAVNAIIAGFGSAITTILVPIIAIVFILFLYMIVKHTGILGRKSKKGD
jgi:heme/copper-type cytochrome/quinol oxidase subunit 2